MRSNLLTRAFRHLHFEPFPAGRRIFFSQNRQQAQNGESRAISRFSAGFGLFLAALIFAGAAPRAAAPARGAAVIRNRQQAGWIGFAQTAHAFRPFPPLRQLSPSELKTICRTVKDWRFSPTGTLGWQQAQSTAGGFCPLSSNPPPWSPRGCPGCMPAASFWISTETAAAIIYNGPGPPLCRREKRRGLAAFSLTASGRGEFLISPFQACAAKRFERRRASPLVPPAPQPPSLEAAGPKPPR